MYPLRQGHEEFFRNCPVKRLQLVSGLFSLCNKYRRCTKQRQVFRTMGVDEWLIHSYSIVIKACTIVRTDAELSIRFEMKVGLHQGSIFSCTRVVS